MKALLVRHAHTDAIGRFLAGRRPGVSLNEAGRRQAARLPERLRRHPLAAIYSSPLERATETAAPLAAARGLDVRIQPALDEIDFGAWTGLSFQALDLSPEWQRYNSHRSQAAVPGGEAAPDVQTRIVSFLDGLRMAHPADTVAVISHGDVIRAAVLHYLTIPLDLFARVEISPASLTVLELGPHTTRLDGINLPDED